VLETEELASKELGKVWRFIVTIRRYVFEVEGAVSQSGPVV